MKKITSNIYYGVEDFEGILDSLIIEQINQITEEIKKEMRNREIENVKDLESEVDF